MEDRRFDQLARTLATAGTFRRTLLRRSVASVFAAALARFGSRSATAGPTCTREGERCRHGTECCSGKCHRKRGKRKGKCTRCPTRCCANADCPAGQVCQDGACVCPAGQFACCPRSQRSCPEFVCCTLGTERCDHITGACAVGCPPTNDWCADDFIDFCGPGCGCATSAAGDPICADEVALNNGPCDCTTDAECGDVSVCVPSGNFCACKNPGEGHCVQVGCPGGS